MFTSSQENEVTLDVLKGGFTTTKDTFDQVIIDFSDFAKFSLSSDPTQVKAVWAYFH